MSTAQAGTPQQRIAAECARHGPAALTAACAALLAGKAADVSDHMIIVLGGEPARYVLDGGEGGRTGYWPRVWGARGLLHQWDPAATAAIIGATHDEAWRVREMAAKVIARHKLGDALDAVAALRADEVERVRAAARSRSSPPRAPSPPSAATGDACPLDRSCWRRNSAPSADSAPDGQLAESARC